MVKIIPINRKDVATSKTKNETLIKAVLCRLMFLGILFFGFMAQAQDPPQYGTPFNGVPDPRDINMYQVHIRPFSANGDLDGVTAQLDRIKSLGINVIYLMPIFPHGTDPQSSPSPYCIKDFKSVASEYGSLTNLRALVDGAHSRGMAVILDIAINGTSWDHPWTVSNPEYYQRSGGTIQQLANFADIAALDLNHAGTRAAIKDAMRYWVFAANIDGYRCDFANNPPLDFWSEIIGDLRNIDSHDLLMLAEGDRQENFTVGFDLNWGDRWFWNALKNIAEGGPVSTRIQTINDYEYAMASGNQQAVRYTGNHDTYTNDNGSHRPFVVFNNHDGIVANFLVSAFIKGVPFLMSGQEIDYEPMTPWPWNGFKFDWSQNPGAAEDFSKILNFRASSTAIRRGSLTMYPNDNVSAFTKTSGSEQVVVIANLRNYSTSYTIPSALAGNWKNAFTGADVTLTSGSNLSLAAYEYLVVTNENVDPVAVTGVDVSPASATMNAGFTQQLSASVIPSNATNQNVTWSSNNTSVATVSNSGLVTAVAAGTAIITATTQDGNHTDNAELTVNPSTNFTVHFYKPASWGNDIRIYWWAAQPSGVLADGSWPGVLMTNEGNGWYSHTFTNVTSTNLIFNDGSNQTADLSRSSDGWYQNGTWYDSNPGGCTPSAITPYVSVNGGSWNQTASATLDAGGSVSFGPHPLSGGSWSWTGPNGYTAAVREISLTNVQTNQSGSYVATYTNTCGASSEQVFSLTVEAVSVNQSAYGGSAAAIPGTVEFENFDNGGEGTAYHDNDAGNNGGQYRSEGVDIESCSEGGHNVGWTGSGEWLEYTVNVASADNYDISLRVAGSGGSFRIEFDGTDKTGTITTPDTGGWQIWQTITVSNVALSAGQQVMRVYMTSGGFNLNHATFTAASTGGGGSAYRIRNRWQNTYLYDNGAQAAYGTPSVSDQNSHWQLETVDGHTAIKNVATGEYLNIEGLQAYVECTTVSTSYWSAQWAIEDYDGHKRIRNRWQSGDYIHVENLTGYAQHGSVTAEAWSSHWVLESVSGSRVADPVLVDQHEINVYPNPAVSDLHVKMKGLENTEVDVSLSDLSGKRMISRSYQVGSNGMVDEKIDIDFLKPGIYFLKVPMKGKMGVVKIVKK